MEYLTLNNGIQMPAFGLGVFQSSPDETVDAVAEALRLGYRHIDTAAAYFNEQQVGEALRQSGLARDEVFIETKVWVSDYGFDATRHAFDKASAKLGLDHIDLLILHQPAPLSWDVTLDAYRGLESLLAEGKVRAIGVSNFMADHLDDLMQHASVVPAVNQIELHPYFQQREVQTKDAELGIVTQAWSPLGGITFYPGWGSDDRRSTLDDPIIGTIGETHGKSPAQVMLRWHLQEGRQVIPKSVKPQRIAENLDVFDFELTDADLAALDALDTGVRGGPDPRQFGRATNTLTIPKRKEPDPDYCMVNFPGLAMAGSGDMPLGAYALTKAAMNGLTIKTAKDLRGRHILVNPACPGGTATHPGTESWARPVGDGARSIAWAVNLPDDGPTGLFFRDRKQLPW